MKPFDVYCGFNLYKISENHYIAKSREKTLTANNYHDIYAIVKLHNV